MPVLAFILYIILEITMNTTTKSYLHHFRTVTNKSLQGHELYGKKRPSLRFNYILPAFGDTVDQAMIDVLDIALPKLCLEMLQHKDNMLNWEYIPPTDYAAIAGWFNRESVSRTKVYTKANIALLTPMFHSVFTSVGKSQGWINTIIALADRKFIDLAAHPDKVNNLIDYFTNDDSLMDYLASDSFTAYDNSDLFITMISCFTDTLQDLIKQDDSLDLDSLL